jgi:phosphatidylglycerol---prolipoprotein diacylglyceryl transferase
VLFAFIHWNIDPEIVNVLGFSLRYYGVLFASGLMLCVWVLRGIFKKENIPANHLDTLTMYGMVGILAGARLGHCLFYEPDYYLNHPLEIILPIKFLRNGSVEFIGYQGLASHGGAIGLIIALILYARKTKHAILYTLDLIAVVTGIAATFIRLANLMNSEIIGMPSQKPWAFIFERVDNLPRHPAQLYEALVYALVFVLTITLYRTKRKYLKHGFFTGLVMTIIFTARFFIEFLKERQVAFEESMVLAMGQWLSIPFVVAGIIFMVYGIKQTRIENKQLNTTG